MSHIFKLRTAPTLCAPYLLTKFNSASDGKRAWAFPSKRPFFCQPQKNLLLSATPEKGDRETAVVITT
jgi:hypothetical protein